MAEFISREVKHVKIGDPIDIPEGWKYTRCDKYTAEEFKNRVPHVCSEYSEIIEQYIKDNPKEYYDTDDELAIHDIFQERRVPGLLHGQNRPTTKRTWYTDR